MSEALYESICEEIHDAVVEPRHKDEPRMNAIHSLLCAEPACGLAPSRPRCSKPGSRRRQRSESAA